MNAQINAPSIAEATKLSEPTTKHQKYFWNFWVLNFEFLRSLIGTGVQFRIDAKGKNITYASFGVEH